MRLCSPGVDIPVRSIALIASLLPCTMTWLLYYSTWNP